MAILDWIYPKKCLGCGGWGCYICQSCQRSIKRRGDGLRYEGVIRQAIKEIKYRGTYDLVTELVSIWSPQKLPGKVLVTAVPMWVGKQKKRGYNQAELIGREVAKQWGATYVELLTRVRATRPMYGLDRISRKINVGGAFQTINQRAVISEQKMKMTVVLIDDVWTSGATINECASALRRGGWEKVVCMALAS